MPQGAVSNGKHIDAFIPYHLRDMFYRHPTRPYAWNNGLDPYGFSTDGLVLYLPLWALKDSTFKSVDAYKHTATVTGALWRPDGRDFDGADDDITIPTATSISDIFDGVGGTAVMWINPDSDGEGDNGYAFSSKRWIISVQEEAASKVKVNFTYIFTGDNGVWTTTATQITIGTAAMVTVTYDADAASNNPTMYINTTALTVGSGLTETTTPTGTRQSDSSQDKVIGINTPAGGLAFDGVINEGFLYKGRVFTAAEVTHHFNTTAWRYQ